jgi:hypothetical protein
LGLLLLDSLLLLRLWLIVIVEDLLIKL